MIGTVISADMDLIGQMQPHQQVRFEPVTMDAALAARQERARLLAELTAAVGG
jgi:allophanate hydrolase subunit 2